MAVALTTGLCGFNNSVVWPRCVAKVALQQIRSIFSVSTQILNGYVIQVPGQVRYKLVILIGLNIQRVVQVYFVRVFDRRVFPIPAERPAGY